ncbi:thioredoxin [Blochmannia endosymbiont of Camponotus modoc]|uniref:thioredoxin n=1 Tax=Blochmannia endosymbiont of Camponotus modoc TaxID=2945587 RepID=UPI002025AFB8|nr:thioredoxin [Blochmannia endosymbiont of Camponotus modoc]URJ26229.1 thioredoxin [Blochmannia endosymbiont of Camponotus modoc]URJ29460.1 thioredoxin [Blochmannia endosymbiont of Camponotus modoc]
MNQIIMHLTDSNFKETVSNSTNLFLVDFWAEWCNPCKAMIPILEDIAVEFNDTLKVAKLNIDENPITTKNYGIKSIPTLLLIRHGTVLSTKVGLLSKQKLQEFLKIHI